MGFQFAETMSGTYQRADAPGQERFFSFDVLVQADSVLRHLRDGQAELRGTLEADGLASQVPIQGTLTMRPWRFIRYEFDFTGDDGRPYRFAGQKDIRWRDARRSFTELPATISDADGGVVATCRVAFDLSSDWLQFATSWKWA